jgi:hypothetical protein
MKKEMRKSGKEYQGAKSKRKARSNVTPPSNFKTRYMGGYSCFTLDIHLSGKK